MSVLNHKAVRDLITKEGRRCGRDFIAALEAHVEAKIQQACGVHNGGKKTLDRTIAQYVGIKPRGDE